MVNLRDGRSSSPVSLFFIVWLMISIPMTKSQLTTVEGECITQIGGVQNEMTHAEEGFFCTGFLLAMNKLLSGDDCQHKIYTCSVDDQSMGRRRRQIKSLRGDDANVLDDNTNKENNNEEPRRQLGRRKNTITTKNKAYCNVECKDENLFKSYLNRRHRRLQARGRDLIFDRRGNNAQSRKSEDKTKELDFFSSTDKQESDRSLLSDAGRKHYCKGLLLQFSNSFYEGFRGMDSVHVECGPNVMFSCDLYGP